MMMIGKIHGYNLTCPVPEQLQFQGTWICKDTESYMCIYDDNNKIYTESCDGPVLFGKGYKAIIRGNIDRERCSDKRYQPYPFNTLRNIKCVFIKSFCNEEGQVTVKNGLAFEDRVCNCDYSKGYAFTLTPRKLIYCIPSEEDCSCYKKSCPEEYRYLSPDYKCIAKSNLTTPAILDTTTNSIKIGSSETYNVAFTQKDLKMKTKAAAFLSIFLIILVVGFIISAILTEKFNCFAFEAGTSSIQFRNKEHTRVSQNKDMFVENLTDVVCYVGQCAQFTCRIKEKINVTWLKYNKTISERNRVIMGVTDYVHTLTINNVTPEDRGQYAINVQTIEQQASLIVIDDIRFTKEDANYLRIVNILLTKALPAIRNIFDVEIHPTKLYAEIHKNMPKLNYLRSQRDINLRQWDLLMKGKEDVSSKHFDLRLLICMLRNIGPKLKVIDELPLTINTSLEANLSRIKFYRNEIAHSHDHGRLSDKKFNTIWTSLCQSIKGLHKNVAIDSESEEKVFSCTSEYFAIALTDSLNPKRKSIPNDGRLWPTEEMNYLRIVHLMHRVVCSAVRIKFDNIFPYKELTTIMKTNKVKIEELFMKKEITPSEWSVLYPEFGLPISQNFGMKLLITFILRYGIKENITEEDSEIYSETLPKLTDISHELAESISGTLAKDAFDNYFDKISMYVYNLSGKYKRRFIDMCCSLCPEKSQHLLDIVGQG